MALKQFAIPLDPSSKQTGDIDFAKLVEKQADVEFRLTNVSSFGNTAQLNLITCKGGQYINHIFTASVNSGVASTTLSTSQVKKVYDDANGGDWDYVEADWNVGQVDTPSTSNLYLVQTAGTYDTFGWPPNSVPIP